MGKWHVTELQCKEVIDDKSGDRLGPVGDVQVDTETGQVVSLVVYGRAKCFGLLGREEDIEIPWKDVRIVGNETVLVCLDEPHHHHHDESHHDHGRRGGFWRSYFR
ncbi:MAG: YlmC/YmxH family sporulation protein [Oscillospiraceae bacterium]|jgi:YlmC/YmxH family sporulation protein|nr:YlmC/YmxH family sporulation protein [Oscillospiraceae bacterium]